MRKYFLILAMGMACTVFAQKKVTCKKGDIKQDGQVVAKYDGVGSMFKMVKLGVFAPGAKDTIISITEESFDPQNPLWPTAEVAYKVEFKNATIPSFYVRNAKNPGVRYMERDLIEMIFNDTVPILLAGNKLDEAAVEKFRASYSYDLDKVKQFVKDVEDSIAILNKNIVARDITKPITFKVINDKSDQFESNQVSEIYQDGVLLGKMIKKVSGGQFAKATYTFWKKIDHVVINGIDMSMTPVAYCNSANNPFDFPITAVVGKAQYKIKGAYNSLEAQIASVLVHNKLL